MKVLYFAQHFCTPAGSAGIRPYAMSRQLIKRGHHVVVICGSYLGGVTGLTGPFSNGVRRGYSDGIEIIEFDLNYSNADGYLSRSVTFLKYAFKSLKLVFSERYDLVFCTSTPLTAGIPGIVARWLLKKPFVFEVRDLWPELPKEMGIVRNPIVLGLMSILEWVSYRSANHVIALSPGIEKGIEKRGVRNTSISLIPNGCDLDIFDIVVPESEVETVQKNELVVLFAGTHGAANGLGSVLDAAAELKKRGRLDIKFILVGQGKLKTDLIDRAKKEGLKNVIFLDPLSKDELAKLMASIDIGLQILANVPVFYYGTSPNKFFDYISGGLPVLNNYPGWISDMILDHDCGFSVPPDDAGSFASALEAAADDRDLLRIKGINAKALAVEQFDRRQLADMFVGTLEEVFDCGAENAKH